jgi:hypothetical protein
LKRIFRLLATAVLALGMNTLPALAASDVQLQSVPAMESTQLNYETYLTLEQGGRTPHGASFNSFWSYKDLYIDESINVTLSGAWSNKGYKRKMSVEESWVNCFLDVGMGLGANQLETRPAKLLGSIPVLFTWKSETYGPYTGTFFDWRVDGSGVIPGPSAEDRGDLKDLTLQIRCQDTYIYSNTWSIKAVVGKPTLKAEPTLGITGNSATATMGIWSGIDNLDVVTYAWFYCQGQGSESNCEAAGQETSTYVYQFTSPLTFNLNSSTKGSYLALLITAYNAYGASKAWTNLAQHGTVPVKSAQPTVNQRTLASFSSTATTLTTQQKSQVEAAVEANPNATKFICTGIRYVSQPMSENIKVRKRAKAACDYAKSLNPELSTWYQNKPTEARSYAGKVLLTIKSPAN